MNTHTRVITCMNNVLTGVKVVICESSLSEFPLEMEKVLFPKYFFAIMCHNEAANQR